MVSIRKKQQNRRLFCHLDDFNQGFVNGDGVSCGRQNVVVNSGSVDRAFTTNSNVSNPTTNEETVIVQTLEKCLTDGVTDIITPTFELVVR